MTDGALEPLPEPAATALSEQLRSVDELAGAFLLSKREPTRSAYRRDLADFATFLAAAGVQPLGVRRVHVDAYARMLERHGAAPSTIARRLACLAGLHAYTLGEELIERNPVEHVDRPTRARTPRPWAPPRPGPRPASRCRPGLRARSRPGLPARPPGAARQRSPTPHRRRRRNHPGAPDRCGSRASADAASSWRSPPPAPKPSTPSSPNDPTGTLFVTRTGRRLDRHHAAKIIARLGRRAGLAYPLTPHGLRHAFITLALDAGASLRDVQDAAGHADPRTTRRYDRARGNLDRSPSYDVARHLAD